MRIYLDIGALNNGRLKRRITKKKYKKYHWVSYEPCRSIYAERKPMECSRLEVHPFAVSDFNGTALLSEPSHSTHGATICSKENGDTYEIKVVSMKSVLDRFDEVYCAHINCEGSEIAILNNTPIADLIKCRIIDVEFHVFIGMYDASVVKGCLDRLSKYYKIKCDDTYHPCYTLRRL